MFAKFYSGKNRSLYLINRNCWRKEDLIRELWMHSYDSKCYDPLNDQLPSDHEIHNLNQIIKLNGHYLLSDFTNWPIIDINEYKCRENVDDIINHNWKAYKLVKTPNLEDYEKALQISEFIKSIYK